MRFGHIPDSDVVEISGVLHQPNAVDPPVSSLLERVVSHRGGGGGSMIDSLDAVQDQLGGTCVGHAKSSAIYLRAQAIGRPIARPSPVLIVAIAQLLEHPKRPIDCDGCKPSTAVLGAKTHGLVAFSEWPETAENLVTIPPEDIFARAEGAKVERAYRIGADVDEGMKAALAADYCPEFAMPVDEAYEQLGSKVYVPGGRYLGNHAQIVVDYDPKRDAFLVLNSWGTGWGDGGFAWIPSWFMRTRTFDRFVTETVPVEV